MSEHKYYPFGKETHAIASPNTHEFTGHERDPESGLDYMLARYYSNGTARFLSSDPALRTDRNLISPQRWNRYSYALGSPLKYLDPDGRDVEVPDNMRPAVLDAYQRSGTFRRTFDSANSNHDIKAKVQAVDKVLDADPKLKGAHADFKGEMGVKTIYQDGSGKQTKDYTVEGVCEVPGVPGNQEAGALIAHELQHAIDIEASGEPQKPGTAGAEAGEEAADKTQDAVNGDYKDPSDDVSKAQAEAAIPK